MIHRVAAAVTMLASLGYLALATGLPRGTASEPGPGLFPVIVGVGLVTAAAAFALRASRGRDGTAALSWSARRRVAVVLVALAAFALLLPRAGFPASAFLFMALLLRQFGAAWRLVLPIAAASAAASYYLFSVVLDVPLPRGAWLD